MDTCRNQIYPVLQSSFRAGHRTETAFLKLMNDIMLAMDSKCVTPLVLLDLSAAFDTINHEILINQLQNKVGLQGAVLNLYNCLIEVSEYLSVEHFLHALTWIAELLKTLLWDRYCLFHSSQLFDVIEKHLPCIHCFADDTQLY